MLKRKIASILAVTMILGLFGCSSNSESNENEAGENNAAAQGFAIINA